MADPTNAPLGITGSTGNLGGRVARLLGASGAAPDATFTLARDHYVTEEHIKFSGMEWTFLRDNLYLDFFPLLAGDDGVIHGPAGDGRVVAVAQDDIAAVASSNDRSASATRHSRRPTHRVHPTVRRTGRSTPG